LEQIRNEKPLCTMALIVINVGIFLVFSILDRDLSVSFMLAHGAMFGPLVLEQGEYYRFLTSMFIHFDIYHVANNMLLLGVLGRYLEPEKGRIKFLIIYFVSGIAGNLLSFGMRVLSGQNVVSGGASGAIFGLMGALLGTLLKYRHPIGRLSSRGMLIVVGFCLYFGLTSSGVDNAAHIGGLICGFLLAMLM